MKVGTLNHPKTRRLAKRLKIPLYAAAGLLESIWHLAGEAADDGYIGRFSNLEIAEYVDWEGDPDQLVQALIECRWLDLDDDMRPWIHDWLDHCAQYIKDRLKKRKQRATKKIKSCDESTGDTPGHNETKSDASPDNPDAAGPVPSLPIPFQPNPTNSPSSGVGEEEGILDLLKAREVAKAKAAYQTASDRGLTDADIRTIIAEFDLHPTSCWDNPAGVLFARLTGDLSNWPPYSKSFVRLQQREAEQQRAAEASEANKRKREETERLHGEYAELEQLYGSEVTALSHEEQEGLLLELYPTPESRAFLRPKQRRLDLLQLFSKRQLNGTV